MKALYIKPANKTIVHRPVVSVGDVMQLDGLTQNELKEVKKLELYHFKEEEVIAISILKVIQSIRQYDPEISVINYGEIDFIVEYKLKKTKSYILEFLKTVGIGVLVTFGSAFTIVAFHNDIDLEGVFRRFYVRFIGQNKPLITELELSYIIGISVGMMYFFNHISRKKLTKDPTPIQVEMKKYDDDLVKTKIAEEERDGNKLDVL